MNQVWIDDGWKSRPLDDGKEVAEKWHKMNGWNQLVDMGDGSGRNEIIE